MKFAYASGSRPLEGYTIKRGIGIGGFGEVYFATSDAGKEVALKRIQRNLDIELRGVSQCLNLKHVNLIGLYDIRYDEHGQGWVVMEYVSGESLKDVVDRNPNGLPRDELEHWFRGIAAGVGYLHDHGIVHRDLKPGNIFCDEDIVKIGDYGLSKFISCSRRSGQTESVGTFHYMAPEIGKGVYGKEIDIYALGIILFEMLTGRVPFEGESSQEIIMKHLTADPDLSGIAEPYCSVIRKAMAKDPDHRFKDVGELMAALKQGVAPAHVKVAEKAKPSPAKQPPKSSETIYINDDEADIRLGPVKEVVNAHPVSPAAAGVAGAAAVATRTNEEPIARAVRDGWGRTADWWNHANMGTPIKVVILVIVAALLMLNAQFLIPAAVVAGAMYLVYYGIRSLILASQQSSESAAVEGSAARGAASHARRGRRLTRGQVVRAALQSKPQSERIAELTGSMLMAAAVSAVLALLMIVVGWKASGNTMESWSPVQLGSLYAWLTVTTVGAAWTVLAVSKFWEGSTGEQVRRRFVMLVAGLALGALAWGSSDLLLIEAANIELINRPQFAQSISSAGGIWGYLAYFAGLFAILRWWTQADPMRTTRLSLWATGACVLWAWILDLFWQFPQPWGCMLAGAIAIAVQLSAPWMSPKTQSRVRQEYQEV